MEKVFVSDLADKQTVHSTFLVKNKVLLTDKKGNSYISLHLADKTGMIDAKIWENIEKSNNSFQSGDIVQIKGLVQLYQNRKQMVVHKISGFEIPEESFSDYIGELAENPEDLFQEILSIVQTLQKQPLRELILNTLQDSLIKEKLLKSPAAKTIHHAQVGGLISHICSICKIMTFIGGHYPHLDKDLLIFGAIFHDIGKIWELEMTPSGVQYTDQGRLIGHLVMSAELVERKASQILGFPESLKMICKHIILSHHGKLEYGSPKLPMIPEAFVVWMIDDLDSKVDSIQQLIDRDQSNSESWTSYSQLYGRHFMKSSEKRNTPT